jgi:hypothetical protein
MRIFAPVVSDLNEKKATQAAARFLAAAGKKMHYLKLLKLMYLMDREALLRWGAPVTNDRYFSLPKGPILSRVKNLMVEEPLPWERGFWSDHISSPSNYLIELVDDTGDDELSEAEEELIDEIFAKYGHIDRFKMIDLLHEILPEWKDPKGSSIPITIADILEAGDKKPEEIRAIESNLASVRNVHALFAGK